MFYIGPLLIRMHKHNMSLIMGTLGVRQKVVWSCSLGPIPVSHTVCHAPGIEKQHPNKT